MAHHRLSLIFFPLVKKLKRGQVIKSLIFRLRHSSSKAASNSEPLSTCIALTGKDDSLMYLSYCDIAVLPAIEALRGGAKVAVSVVGIVAIKPFKS